MKRLLALKNAMKYVTRCCQKEREDRKEERQFNELGEAMRFLRALKSGNMRRVRDLTFRTPELFKKAMDKDGYYTPARVEAWAEEIARTKITEDINQLANERETIEPDEKQRRKEHIIRKLRRVSGSGASTIAAIQRDNGQVVTGIKDMVKELENHWEIVFQKG